MNYMPSKVSWGYKIQNKVKTVARGSFQQEALMLPYAAVSITRGRIIGKFSIALSKCGITWLLPAGTKRKRLLLCCYSVSKMV